MRANCFMRFSCCIIFCTCIFTGMEFNCSFIWLLLYLGIFAIMLRFKYAFINALGKFCSILTIHSHNLIAKPVCVGRWLSIKSIGPKNKFLNWKLLLTSTFKQFHNFIFRELCLIILYFYFAWSLAFREKYTLYRNEHNFVYSIIVH